MTDKEGRVEESLALLEGAAKAGRLRAPEAASLRGRLQYTRSQTFGRTGAVGLQALSALASTAGMAATLGIRDLADFWLEHFRARCPRRINVFDDRPPVCVFTDGAVESEDCGKRVTIGGVLFDPLCLSAPEYFAEQVAGDVVKDWCAAGVRHPVYLAELLPLAVAAATWQLRLAGRRAFFFLDNDAARSAAIRGFSLSPVAARLVTGLWAEITKAGAYVWFARVASASNPADAPSRLAKVPAEWAQVGAVVPTFLAKQRWFRSVPK